MYCLAPLSSLSYSAAEALAALGHEPLIIDDYGRCSSVLAAEPPRGARLVDAKPGSKPLSRIIRRCEVFLLAWDPWDAGACGGWESVLTGYLLDVLRFTPSRVVVTLPAGAYAWSTNTVDCNGLPSRPPRSPLYGWPLAAATAALSSLPDALVVVHPPLLHHESRVVEGAPEPINWFEKLLATRVLEAPRGSRLTVLDYRDAGETLALLLEGVETGLWCMGGVEVSADECESLAERVSWRTSVPSTLVVRGEGVRRRTMGLLRRLGVHK